MAYNDGWKTINGNHVYFEDGVITKGPKALVGKDYNAAMNTKKQKKPAKNYIKETKTEEKSKLKEQKYQLEEDKDMPEELVNVTKKLNNINASDVEDLKMKYEHAQDKFDHYKFNGANDPDRIKYKQLKDKAYDDYVKAQREYDENRLAPKEKAYIPYKYGSYTPGEFHEAEIESRNEFSTTLLYPNKLQPTNEQVKSWNGGRNFEVGDTVKAPYGIGNVYTGGEMHDFKVLETGKYPVLEGRSRIEITNDQLERFNKEYLKTARGNDKFYNRLSPEQKAKVDNAYKKGIQEYEAEKRTGERIGQQIKKDYMKKQSEAYKNYIKNHPNSKMSEDEFKRKHRG